MEKNFLICLETLTTFTEKVEIQFKNFFENHLRVICWANVPSPLSTLLCIPNKQGYLSVEPKYTHLNQNINIDSLLSAVP